MMELFEARKKLIENRLVLEQSIKDNRKAEKTFDWFQSKTQVLNLAELDPTKKVFIHLHCRIEGCSNVFVKCNVCDANDFFQNWEILNEFVEIYTLNWGDTQFKLNKVNMALCTEIFQNQTCENYCDICTIKNKYKYKNWECKFLGDKLHLHDCGLVSDGNLFYYKETTLFESIMLYCFQSLIKQMIRQYGVKIKIVDSMGNSISDYENVKVTKVELIMDSESRFGIDFPTSNFSIKHRNWDKFPEVWFEPIKLNNVALIGIINKFVEMYKEIINSDSEKKKLIITQESS